MVNTKRMINMYLFLALLLHTLPTYSSTSRKNAHQALRNMVHTLMRDYSPEDDFSSQEEGIPCIEVEAVQESTDEIMTRQLTHIEDQEIGKPRIHTVTLVDRENLPQDPNSPYVSSFVNELYSPVIISNENKTSKVQRLAGVVALTFTGSTFNDSGFVPPDSMGHVGQTQFIVCINGLIRSFNKNTGIADGVLNASLNTFFNSVRNNVRTTDPRIRYDKFTQKWFVICVTGTNQNRILLAVSSNATITSSTVWSFYYLQQDLVPPPGDTGALADYPALGIDTKALYIGVSQFTQSGFIGTTGFVIIKNSVVSGGPIQAYAFRNLNAQSGLFSPQGVDNFDPAPNVGYFIGTNSGSLGSLVLRRISNLDSTPTISGNIYVTVPATAHPLTVPHLGNTGGTNGYLSAVDDRLMSAHIRNGKLWTAHSIGVTNTGVASNNNASRNGCRWYQLDMSTPTPTLIQAGTLFTPSASNSNDQRFYWFPGIMTSEQGDMVLGCSTAGINEHANAAFSYRLSNDPLGQLRPATLYTNSTTAYNPSFDQGGSGGRRWGDYSYTSLDPDGSTMYTIQEFCGATNTWYVQVAKILGSTTLPVPVAPVLNPISVNPATPRNYTVSWNSVANATSYTLQQSTTSNFASPTTVTQGNVLSQAFVNQPNGTYYYRVLASNASGTSPFSNVQNVVINVQAPAPVAPVLNPITVNPATPSNYAVSWNSVANATSYTLQQSTTSNFANPITVAQGNILSQSFVNQPNGIYVYRVLASNSSGNSPFSNVQCVVVQTSVPVAPVLNPIPVNPATPRNYTVSWNSVANATSYTLQQSTTSNFASPTTVAQGNVLSQSFVNQSNGTYYYRVLASNTSGNSPFSNVQTVTINVSTAPVAPVLNPITVNPATPRNYTVSWNAVANASVYTLLQSPSPIFTDPTTVAQGNITSQSFVNQPNGTYYYLVIASNANGNSPFSNIRSVTINV